MGTENSSTGPDLSRRGVIRGAAVGGLVLPVLAACGSDEPTAEPTGGDSPASSTAGGGGGAGGGGAALAATSDVPVGGGTVLAEEKVVLTQPTKGEFKAFTAVCTHQGCTVGSVADGKITCPCHGSQFSIEDGANVTGPSGSAAGSVADLASISIQVKGEEILRS